MFVTKKTCEIGSDFRMGFFENILKKMVKYSIIFKIIGFCSAQNSIRTLPHSNE